ncbi:MAG TPA: DUF21 domain-containing protein [Planctomycetaceae bacterium]|nr:DUF21 domain-containing protein [Planctomycetaceae bacterium]
MGTIVWLDFVGAVALFLLGLRLSAFFSGAEIGFYRVSFVRLGIQAHRGDQAAIRVLRFARNPAYFLATTLIGNNLANYLTTVAIGIGTTVVTASNLPSVEIIATLLVSPVVFVFGELMPKNLYHRAPTSLLRKDSAAFEFFFLVFLPVSLPLIAITKALERRGGAGGQNAELVLGRKRLVQVLTEGHEQGILADIQRRMAYGVLHAAAKPVAQSMTPLDRVLGLADDVSKEDVVAFGRRYGISSVVIRRANSDADWYGYVRVVDAAIRREPLSDLIRTMPRLGARTSKLEALAQLHAKSVLHAVVTEGGQIVGIINERGLIEQLIRVAQAPHFPDEVSPPR